MAILERLNEWTTPDGERLHCPTWLPEGEPRADLVLVHGVGEHSGRYGRLTRALISSGISVHGGDLRGHGRSTGRRGHVSRWAEYREDLLLRLARVREAGEADRPLFLMGHSLGALVVLEALVSAEVPVTGVIVSGAPICPVGVAKPFLVCLARVLSVVWPTLRIRLPIVAEDLVSEEGALEEWADDPLLFSGVTARWGIEALAAVERVKAGAAAITQPLLVLHGGRDPVNDRAGAEWLLRAVGSADKELQIYEQSRHEPHNDLEKESVMRDLTAWMMARIP